MDLKEYQLEIGKIYVNEEKLKNLYLRDLALGKIQGPSTGYASIDKPWLKYYTKEAIMSEEPKKTVYEWVYESNKNYLENNALQFFNKYITFGELFENIDKVAKSLKKNGINEGDIINVSLPNIPESVYIFYALSKIGAIANMIDPRASSKDIMQYLNEVNSNMIIMLEDAVPKLYPIINNTNIKKIVKVSAANSLNNNNEKERNYYSDDVIIENYNAFIDSGKKYKGELQVKYKPNMPVVIEHTGGTTGTPKGVLLSNDAINMIAYHFMISDLKFARDQKWLNIMPPFIAYGVGNGLHLPLVVGMCVVAVPKFEPDKIDELIAMYHPNNFTGVPIHYESIIKSNKLDGVDFSKWVLPGVGGDTMNTELEIAANKFLREHNSKTNVIKGYGLTEVCAAACVTFGEANELGSVGIPFLKNNISIFDKDENDNYVELPYGKRGEICIQSPSVMLEYYNNEKETNNILKKHSDGSTWVHTGDVGYITKNGLIYIDGRTKRIILRYDGFKIYPFGIENFINSMEEVEECKVVSTPDIDHIQGFLPQANIILKPEYIGHEEEILSRIIAKCQYGLAEYVVPTDYKIINEFPRTAIGKVDYVAMENENIKKLKRKK